MTDKSRCLQSAETQYNHWPRLRYWVQLHAVHGSYVPLKNALAGLRLHAQWYRRKSPSLAQQYCPEISQQCQAR
ncbi:Uncharacterised protein [Vibrio cholerae]|nr:Uncharacterised protein [Vibrio cholerae]